MRRVQYSHGAAGKAIVRNQRPERWSFRPGLATTLATALLLPLLLGLGEWQLQRGAQKAALQAHWTAQAALPPLHIASGDLPDLRAPPGRRLLVRGDWDTRRQILLDNQVVGGQAGYQVYTPLRLADGHAVLVTRGWLPGGPRRDVAPPDVQLVPRAALVAGSAAPPPSSGPLARQAVDATLGDGLLRVQQLDIEVLSQHLGMKLAPWTLRLDPAAPDGYLRHWQMPWLGAERHRAYALQWFLFAVLLVGLYVGLNLRR
jgi:surfeit locus 1 family protein